MLKMPAILVSGENSFIGKAFRKFSTFKDVRLISLRKTAPGIIDFSGTEIVLHLAAIVHSSGKIPLNEYLAVNRDLTLDFARHAKKNGVRHFIFLSTVKVYGKYQPGSTWNEMSACNPSDNYGKSKMEAENELRKLEDETFIVTVIRTPLVYGPGNKANILKLVKLVKSLPIVPLGSINNTRHFNYIENLVSFIDRCIETNIPGVFISMDPDAVSTSDLTSYIAAALNRRVWLFSIPGFIRTIIRKAFSLKYEQLFGSFVIDNSFSNKLLNYTPQYSTKEGIFRSLQKSNE